MTTNPESLLAVTQEDRDAASAAILQAAVDMDQAYPQSDDPDWLAIHFARHRLATRPAPPAQPGRAPAMSDLLLVEKVREAIKPIIMWDGDRLDMNLTRDDITTVATAAIAAMEAHRPPVTVASPGYEAGLVEGFKQGIEAAAKVADSHREARKAAQANATSRKQRQEARDHESMAIEALHIATAIRALHPPSVADDRVPKP